MKKEHKQTWWDKDIKSQFNEFKSWVGSTNEASKRWARNYITSNKYNSIIDIGCGMCDDYFVYKQLNSDIEWLGADSSKFLITARDSSIPVVNTEAHDTNFDDNQFEVAYSRHVLEHQEKFKPILTEMIRIASKLVVHIFFIPPREKEIINYTESNNLYHNTFSRQEVEKFLSEHDKVKKWEWVPMLSTSEEVLVIKLK